MINRRCYIIIVRYRGKDGQGKFALAKRLKAERTRLTTMDKSAKKRCE